MDGQDHKTTATSTGHEGHGVQLCHICGWPFPNPHPSARHRRAHKKVCGTIEGYKIANSEEHGRHLPDSDDDHPSDEDEHTPSPNLVKNNAEGSSRVGEKSNKSADDVYSDAVTDFSDSGISPRLEERFESVRETEPKGDHIAADRTEQSNEAKKMEEITNPGPLVNGSNPSEGIISKTDTSGEAVSVTLDSEEGKVSEVERQEELCDKPVTVSEVVKHDLPPQTKTLQEGENAGARSAERSTSDETVKVAPVDGTCEKEDDSVGLREVSLSTEEIGSVGTIEVALVNEAREKEDDFVGLKEVSHSTEEIRPVGAIDQEVKPHISLDEQEKCDVNGKENRHLESKESFYFDTVGSFSYTDNTPAQEDDRAFDKDAGRCEMKSDGKHLDEKSEAAAVEEQVIIPDSTTVSDKATNFPTADADARKESELLIGNSTNDGAKAEETTGKLDREVNLASSTPGVDKSHSSQDLSPSKPVSSAELDGNFLVSEIGLITLSSKEAPSDSETCATGDDKTVIKVEDEVDDKLTKDNDAVSAINLSGSSSDRADSMDANCGSVVSDATDTISQKPKATTEEAQPDKSDTFEPPSFMTLVQPGGGKAEEEHHAKAGTEIETVQNNQHQQQPKSDALQAGWFPSLTNVVNESEGRKKNEEIIAKVTNWSPVKQHHHGPLKTLLNEVKSPNTKQVESEFKDSNGGVAPATKDQDVNKDAEEWNSPARYPIEIKKEKKKKGRSYWVPFVCCSSVHRDL